MAASRRRYTSVTCASCLVLHAHQRRRKTRDLRRFGDDERDRLTVEHDPVVVERPERRSCGRHVILVGLIVVRHGRTVLVRKHVEHALDAQGGAEIDACDATLCDCRRYNAAISKAWHVELGGIFCGAGDLREAVDAGSGSADVRCHGRAQTIFLDDCDCGVPAAACSRARTIARRASSILKLLCAKPMASCKMTSAASPNAVRLGCRPSRVCSASGTRQGLWATPPKATRASFIAPASILRAAATETRAKA